MSAGAGGSTLSSCKLKESPRRPALYAAPGNGGIASDAVCVPIAATDVAGVVSFAVQEGIDYVVVAPDDPLVLGMVDALAEKGHSAFGSNKAAAILEGSKVFSKNLMKKYGIPTAAYETFADAGEAAAYVRANRKYPLVVKADGLALEQGRADLRGRGRGAGRCEKASWRTGSSARRAAVSSSRSFSRGRRFLYSALPTEKPSCPWCPAWTTSALDGDRGLNTGGMGTIAPNPYYTPQIAQVCMETIFKPTVAAMNAEGRPFKGCLYFGLMLTPDGPKVIEYNCRFGDPETRWCCRFWRDDLLAVMQAATNGTLAQTEVKFSGQSAACVVLASGGYPQHYEKESPSRASRTASCRAAGPPCTTQARPLRTMCSSPAAGACWASPPWRIRCLTPWPRPTARQTRSALRGLHRRSDIGQKALAAL